MRGHGRVGGIDLFRVVTAAPQALQLRVGEARDERREAGIDAEEMFADVGPRLDRVLLVVAVDDLAHAAHEETVGVAGEEVVPVIAPDDLFAGWGPLPHTPKSTRLYRPNVHRPTSVTTVLNARPVPVRMSIRATSGRDSSSDGMSAR